MITKSLLGPFGTSDQHHALG